MGWVRFCHGFQSQCVMSRAAPTSDVAHPHLKHDVVDTNKGTDGYSSTCPGHRMRLSSRSLSTMQHLDSGMLSTSILPVSGVPHLKLGTNTMVIPSRGVCVTSFIWN
jgi:hypothetical protein